MVPPGLLCRGRVRPSHLILQDACSPRQVLPALPLDFPAKCHGSTEAGPARGLQGQGGLRGGCGVLGGGGVNCSCRHYWWGLNSQDEGRGIPIPLFHTWGVQCALQVCTHVHSGLTDFLLCAATYFYHCKTHPLSSCSCP